MFDVNDNGYSSRKLWLTVFSIGMVAAGGVLCVFIPALMPMYGTYCGAIAGLNGLYFGANVGAKSVLSKANGNGLTK